MVYLEAGTPPNSGTLGSMARVLIPVPINRGYTVLFLLPFVGFGAFVFVRGLRSLVNGDMPRGEAIGIVVFGIVFAVVPLAVMWAQHKKVVALAVMWMKAQSERKAHVENPWLWKKEWADGRVRSGSRAGVVIIWVFSLTFSGFCIPNRPELSVAGRRQGGP